MSSTEQKNVTQPFIDCSHTYGIYPAMLCNSLCNYSLDTNLPPFTGLGETNDLHDRLLAEDNPVDLARRIIPVLDGCPLFTRYSMLLIKLCARARTYAGNQAIMRIYAGIIGKQWGIRFGKSGAISHANQHVARICSYMAPGSYGQAHRTYSNVQRISRRGDSSYCRLAADCFDQLRSSTNHQGYGRRLRTWCNQARSACGIRTTYRTTVTADATAARINAEMVDGLTNPPFIRQSKIYTDRFSKSFCDIYWCGNHYILKIRKRHKEEGPYCNVDWSQAKKKRPKTRSANTEVYILSRRDLDDLSFLLQAYSNVLLYHQRRWPDAMDIIGQFHMKEWQTKMRDVYVSVATACGNNHNFRNKLGVYFDVLQWRYLAYKSGDVYYNHSAIMKDKVRSKGLQDLPSQEPLLQMLRRMPVDIAVDMLGIYKASIYPEVDPYKVVTDQYKLHMSRFDTDWKDGSSEKERFQLTRSYMWFLGIRVLFNKYQIWPGKVRDGAEQKDWHEKYATDGIPSREWRDACDVDLTGCIKVADISNEQYIKQQDSACAPPKRDEYRDWNALRTAPRRHKRKLLYAIQEPDPPDLPAVMCHLHRIGRSLPDGYVGSIEHDLEFSTDIVTGSRCERHKDAPRPFYAASPPWGCILSYFDGLTRDFLADVPQSMMGKSTRQKFMDLESVAHEGLGDDYTFYMSDDKAKYSPHMDPNSQQMPAEFFAELFDLPALRACGPIMYHNELYYRVNGHLIHYNSNGTDREGMRGASNTWLEIVAQGLSTRLCREAGLIRGKSTFLSFIDDGLRKFSILTTNRSRAQCEVATKRVIEDVIFGLKVLGRELSWDKTFVSRRLFVILNELVYDKAFVSSGLKSYCTVGDIEMKEVMSAADYEQLYFGKLRGAHGVGCPADLSHYTYVYEVLLRHYKMGLKLQDNKKVSNIDYRLFCITPIALGGGGIRTLLQLTCNETANATKEGIGTLLRLGHEYPVMMGCVAAILEQPHDKLDPVDYMRDPEQFHVAGPRLRTQRVAAEVRKRLRNLASNPLSRKYVELDDEGRMLLRNYGLALLAVGDVSAEEVRLLYAMTPVAFLDNFIQKLMSSSTLGELLGGHLISTLRRQVRRDLVLAVHEFSFRCMSKTLLAYVRSDVQRLAIYGDVIMK